METADKAKESLSSIHAGRHQGVPVAGAWEGRKGFCEEEEEDPTRIQLWDAEIKDTRAQGLRTQGCRVTRVQKPRTQKCRDARAGRKLHRHFQPTPSFSPMKLGGMGSQWDFGECRNALEHFSPLPCSCTPNLYPGELGRTCEPGGQHPQTLFPWQHLHLSPWHGKKENPWINIWVFLLKYCYTKWNATAISV